MNSEKALWSSITILIGAVIAVMALVRGNAQVWLLLGVFTLWGLWVVRILLLPYIKRAKRNMQRKELMKQLQKEGRAPVLNQRSEPAELVMLRHVNQRITDYLHRIYPEATWEWCEKSPEKLIMDGGVGRIRVHGVEDYDHADIKIDTRANITCSMVKIVPLTDLNGNEDPEDRVPPNKQPVDPQIWYELQGRAVLESVIGDLHSRGYSTLTLREDGDILIEQDEGDVAQDHLNSFPEKVYWPQLIKVLQGEGMAAEIVPKGIQLTW